MEGMSLRYSVHDNWQPCASYQKGIWMPLWQGNFRSHVHFYMSWYKVTNGFGVSRRMLTIWENICKVVLKLTIFS